MTKRTNERTEWVKLTNRVRVIDHMFWISYDFEEIWSSVEFNRERCNVVESSKLAIRLTIEKCNIMSTTSSFSKFWSCHVSRKLKLNIADRCSFCENSSFSFVSFGLLLKSYVSCSISVLCLAVIVRNVNRALSSSRSVSCSLPLAECNKVPGFCVLS